MTIQEFITQNNGKTDVGDTSANKGQCVGLVEAFYDTLGLPHIWGNAKDMPADASQGAFDVVSNTPIYIPPVGAAVVYPAGWEGSAVGHVALVAPGTTASTLNVFEANDRVAGGNGAARLHSFSYTTGLTVAQVSEGWPKFIIPKALEQPAPPPTPPAAPPVATSAEGTFNVVEPLPGYTTASNAANRLNPTTTVPVGNYSVFNQADGMVNLTHNAGVPGSWVNPADNKAPAVTSPAPAADYDGNAITIQPGWGLSNAATAAGYPDRNSPIRWSAIAALNGSNDWQAYNSSLKAGQRIIVGKYEAPAAPAAPTEPAKPANTTYSKLAESLNLITNKQPTHIWMLDFTNDTQAHAAFDVPQGTPFVAYGKAQRTDGDKPAYFMTAEDFGNADTTGIPVNNRGANTVDLSPAPTKVPVANPAPTTETPDYEATYKDLTDHSGNRTTVVTPLETATTAVDVSGQLPDKLFPAGTPITEAGTFEHNGHKYVRSETSRNGGTWYGYPIEAFPAQPAPPASAPAVPSRPGLGSVDSIQAPSAEPAADPALQAAEEVAAIAQKLSLGQWVASILARTYGGIKLYAELVFHNKRKG